MKALVGDEYTCQLGVEDMDDPVRRAVLKGKALNVLTEVSAEALIADGGFKTLISTEEPVLLDAKYRPPEMYVPTAKHAIATNNAAAAERPHRGDLQPAADHPVRQVIAEDKQDRALLDASSRASCPASCCGRRGRGALGRRHGQWPVVEAAGRSSRHTATR
jgi:hypothetical protein